MQLALELKEPLRCTAPHPNTQAHTLLMAFYRNEKLTVAEALNKYGIYALSQRVGELKRLGWPISSKMIETTTGKHVAMYWISFE